MTIYPGFNSPVMSPPLFVSTKLRVVLMLRRRMGLDLLLWFCFSLGVLLRLLPPHEASVLGSVVGATATALHPQHVVSHCAVGLAVIAYDL